jgi:AAHS family 4-hydroxybenzoate transporter-like MFS transporter
MAGVLNLGYVVLGVKDISAWERFSGLLGIGVSRRDDFSGLELRIDSCRQRVLVEQTGEDDIRSAGWELSTDEKLIDFVSQLKASGYHAVDWRGLIVIGGVLPICIGVGAMLSLPESPKFLGLRPGRRRELDRFIQRVAPETALDLVASEQAVRNAKTKAFWPGSLFGDQMKSISVLLWATFFLIMAANYVILSWLPFILSSLDIPVQQTGAITALYAFGSMVGGVIFAASVHLFGSALITMMFIVGVPTFMLLGAHWLPIGAFTAIAFLGGICTGAIQIGLNTTSGLLYPTEIRAKGTAWGLAAGRVGSFIGPMMGSIVIAMSVPASRIFLVAAAPIAIGSMTSLALTVYCYRRFGSLRLRESKQVQEGPLTTGQLPSKFAEEKIPI